MGLISLDQVLNRSNNRFVAVEYDIFTNEWDPTGEHVGIDINSLKSKANVSWSSNIFVCCFHCFGRQYYCKAISFC